VRRLLTLLTEVVSLPSLPLIKFAIALDWYKIPVDNVDPRDWPNTEVGELVSNGKYRYRTVKDRQRQVGRNLAGRICNAIERHAALNNAEIILNIPGHDSTVLSFGSRLAATVAMFTRSQMLRVGARSEFRPAAKDLTGAERVRILDNEFVVSPEARGHSVLIVDDVFRSGDSVAAVAKAAHEVGAREIFAICATRTMRR
jgi:predicted amidophosphoribosyltransferase